MRPLILDKRVAQAIGWRKTADWSTGEYSAYLDLVEALHRQWRPDLPTDVIEYTLGPRPCGCAATKHVSGALFLRRHRRMY
ncbi:8-oxoguanine DNA glycosylase OGG fold protein [Corynebacterium gerontici]|uniref:Uncharacterized protein n=1 Tax=Corynebacterium gerontici TaxID=2079234 RepID=A0A3G6J2Y1_9CORY|nr:hypothetical protein [Corynebacterium gerontici]AZA12266.1 hypothetical protein CGERO_09895 [Corynebacterium gerontici]